MYGRFNKIIINILLATVSFLYSSNPNDLKVLGIRVDFPIDEHEGTTGNGKFIFSADDFYCDNYTVDPPPHDKSYFESQLKAVNNYYRSVSNGQFGIDLQNSAIFPTGLNDTFTMPEEMAHYHPLGSELNDDERKNLHEERITQLFNDALTTAYQSGINFNQFDVVVIFHAGISQDFNINLDTTPEDIPSTFIDNKMISNYIGESGIYVGGRYIMEGIILPETQNHILYPESIDDFQNNGVQDVCEYQNGLTGTFALMIGQAIGLPPLWNTETGQSGVGVFGLMDQGSNNGQGLIPAPPVPWSRIKMGWEEAETVILNKIIGIESRPKGKTLRVDINESEYFLIDNRTNWFRSNVNIDSVNYSVYTETDTIPNVIKLIFDSVGVEIDENGVIVSIPDYDIGLPGSGLLIWHIDENIISDKVQTNSINNDPGLKGIDLEEAGGPQDMGFVSTGIFRDPSYGEPYDMWYAGNPEYEELNANINDKIEFSPFTFPNTNSNSGAVSNLTIENIGTASDTMLILITNNLTLPGFPDASLNLIYHSDFNGDGMSELIGGTDGLWWSETDNVDKKVFYQVPSKENYYTITNSTDSKNLVVLSILGDSLKYVWFEFDNGFEIINEVIQQNVYDSIDHLIGNGSDKHVILSTENNNIELVNSKNGKNILVLSSMTGGFTVGDQLSNYNEISFKYISAIDLDVDGKIEILAVDETGNLYAFNQNYTFATGFPINPNAVPPILAKNIIGDITPEIVFKNRNGELLILNNIGDLQYRLSDNKNSKLIMLGEHNNRNTIVTESNIWIFDEISENGGNEWTTWYGDENNSNRIEINYFNSANSDGKLFDKKRTYIYPNPIRNNIAKIRMFNYSSEKVEIKIYDSAGYFVDDIIENIDINNGAWEAEWDVTDIESGVYLINLTALNGNKEESTILKVGVIH